MEIIHIIGNLTKDAVVRASTRQGVKTEFLAFSVACNTRRGDADEVTFYDVVSAKTRLGEYLKKGTKVAVLGNFHPVLSSDASGRPYLHLNVGEISIELLGSAPKKEAQPVSNDAGSVREAPSVQESEVPAEGPDFNFPQL